MIGTQKKILIIAVLLVVASLSIGINIGLTWDIGILPQPSQVTSTPTPTSLSTKMTIVYSEQSRATIGSNTRMVIFVNATLTNGNSVSLSYNFFTLRLYVPRGGVLGTSFEMQYASVEPKESGSITVESEGSRRVSFRLTFEFPSKGENFDDNLVPFSSYQLGYEKSPPSSIEWVKY